MIMAKKEQPGGDFLVKTEDRMPAEQIARAQDEMYKAIDLAEADLFNLLKENRASVLKLDPGEKQKYIRNLSTKLANAVFDFFNEQNIYMDNMKEAKKLRGVIDGCKFEIEDSVESFINYCTRNINSHNFNEEIPVAKERLEQSLFDMVMKAMKQTGVGIIDNQLSWDESG